MGAWRLSDVPIGSMLSGGIDSSSLAALLTQANGGPIHTFNIGFPGTSIDESAEARQTAEHIRSQHHTLSFSLDDFDHLPQMIAHMECPHPHTHLAQFMLFKLCRQAGFKVIMVGEGADEMLGGYPWYRSDARLRQLLQLPRPARSLLVRLPLEAMAGLRRPLRQMRPLDAIERYILFQQYGLPQIQERLLNVEPPRPLAEQWREQYAERIENLHPFDQMVFLESQSRLVNFINFGLDRASMAHSVEARPPFLDHLLWEFTVQLPPTLKLNRQGNKRLLRTGMQGRLPHSVLERPKRGLGTPNDLWWRSERLPSWVEELMQPNALAESGYFKAPEVERLLRLHRAGSADMNRPLNTILSTQIWHFQVLRA